MTANIDLRREARANGVPLWRIASELNVSEPTMTRKLRKELSIEEKAKIFAIISQIADGGGANA